MKSLELAHKHPVKFSWFARGATVSQALFQMADKCHLTYWYVFMNVKSFDTGVATALGFLLAFATSVQGLSLIHI